MSNNLYEWDDILRSTRRTVDCPFCGNVVGNQVSAKTEAVLYGTFTSSGKSLEEIFIPALRIDFQSDICGHRWAYIFAQYQDHVDFYIFGTDDTLPEGMLWLKS